MPIKNLVPRKVLYSRTEADRLPAMEWLDSMKDVKGEVAITRRMMRIEESGNLGDFRHLDKGLYELRIDFGPGYHVYFCVSSDDSLVILLLGGDKGSQDRDIKKAKEYLQEYLANPELTHAKE